MLSAGESAPASAPKPPVVTSAQSVHLQIDFTTPPKSFRLLSLGKEVWSDPAPSDEIEHDLTLAYPKEGVDLQFEVGWPENVRSSARVRLTDPQGVEHEKGVWGTGPTTEVLTFP